MVTTTLEATRSAYTDQQRREAVVQYSLLGNMKRVSEATGIPRTTLNGWRDSDWWGSLEVAVRQETEAQILAANEKIIEKAHEELLDRLESGDEKLVKINDRYEIRRVGVSAKDLAVVAAVSFDKRRLALNLPTSINGSAGSIDAIKKLADEFRAVTSQYCEKRINAIPGELADSCDQS